jgi:nucleoside-diphosphate-sugar epimerase
VRFLQHFEGRLVLLSSGAVYHGLRGPVGPSSKLEPRFPYATSKLAAERYIAAFADGGRLREHVVLRVFHPFGPGEPERRIMARLVRAFGLERRQEFTVFGDGSTLMDVLPVTAVAAMAVSAALAPVNGVTLDVCAGNPPSLAELVRHVGEAFDIRATVVPDPQRAEEPIEFHADPEPTRRMLGAGLTIPLEQAVREYADWMSTHPQDSSRASLVEPHRMTVSERA